MTTGEIGGALEVTGLSAGYRPRHPVLRELTLAPLVAGETVALVGPNGAGKSTLLRAIAGLIPSTGSIRLDGVELANASLRARAARMAFMPQALPHRVALSVLEGVMGSLRASPLEGDHGGGSADARERAVAAIERVGVMYLALQSLDRLSGGERQLASLAQAIVRSPRLLLLDEPTSALDLRHQVAVMSLVRELAHEGSGRVVVVVLHDLNLAARWADRVVVLERGAVRATGAPEDAITPEILGAVYGVDARVERCTRGRLQIMVDGMAAVQEAGT